MPDGHRSRGSHTAITRRVGDSCSLLVVRGRLQPPEHTLGTRRAGPCTEKPRAGEWPDDSTSYRQIACRAALSSIIATSDVAI